MRKRYPRGQIRPDDEGATRMAISVQNNTFVIQFPKPVVWFGLGAHEARALGERLLKFAEEMEQ